MTDDIASARQTATSTDSAQQAWTLRHSEPRLALAAVNHALTAATCDEERVVPLAAKAAACLSLDDPVAAREAVDELLGVVADLAGEEAVEEAVEEASDALVERRSASAVYRRPPRIDADKLSAEVAEVVVEGSLTGLRAAYLDSDAEAAVPLGRFALELAGAHGLIGHCARAHNELAAVYGAREFNERALFHLRSGIELLEQHGFDVSPALLNNLGNVYLEGERLDEALACFQRGRQSFEEGGEAFGAAIAASNVGRVMVRLGRAQEGIAELEEALDAFDRLGRRAYVGATYGKLGVAYASLGDNERAERNFLYALASFADDVFAPFRMEVNGEYGRFLLDVGQPEEALEQFSGGEVVARKNSTDSHVVAFLRGKAEALSALGRHQEAYAMLLAHVEGRERLEHQRGRDVIGILLLELQTKLSQDHELSVLTSQVLSDTNRALRDQAKKLERLSSTDDLTGLANRRFLNGRLVEEVGKGLGYGRDISLVLVDVDGFKQINDGYSHLIGDEVLRRLAGVMRANVRRADVVARWGGEEFAILLPGAGKQEATEVAEKVRDAVAVERWGEVADGLSVTVSAGVASLSDVVLVVRGGERRNHEDEGLSVRWLDGEDTYGSIGEPVEELLKLADRRLYRAKQGGRDRIDA